MTEDKSTLINTCVICGYKTNTRHVKGQGHTCIQCIKDDDLVFCDQCGEYHKFKDFPVKAIRKNGLIIRRRICKDCYKLKGENTVSICKKCGRHASLRLVKDKGTICNDCIKDDDLVFCESCREFKPWVGFPLREQTKGYRWGVCKECKDKGATVRYNPFNGAIYKTCGYGSKRKCSKRKRLPLKTRRLLSRYKHAVHVNNGTMYIDIDFAVRFMKDPHLQAPKLIELYHHLMGVLREDDFKDDKELQALIMLTRARKGDATPRNVLEELEDIYSEGRITESSYLRIKEKLEA